jgi:hypothetical protein
LSQFVIDCSGNRGFDGIDGGKEGNSGKMAICNGEIFFHLQQHHGLTPSITLFRETFAGCFDHRAHAVQGGSSIWGGIQHLYQAIF